MDFFWELIKICLYKGNFGLKVANIRILVCETINVTIVPTLAFLWASFPSQRVDKRTFFCQLRTCSHLEINPLTSKRRRNGMMGWGAENDWRLKGFGQSRRLSVFGLQLWQLNFKALSFYSVTLESRINVGLRLLIFGLLSRGYVLIEGGYVYYFCQTFQGLCLFQWLHLFRTLK